MLQHSERSVRAAAVDFIAAAAGALGPADVHVRLVPLVSKAVHAESLTLLSPPALAAALATGRSLSAIHMVWSVPTIHQGSVQSSPGLPSLS